MADVDLSAMTGADLTDFREAMLRAGMECLLGKATVDCNALGDTPISINASEDYVITKILFGNATVNPPNSSVNGVIRTGASGGGYAISTFQGTNNSGVFSIKRIDEMSNYSNFGTGSMVLSAPTLYVNIDNVEGAALSADVLIFGIYAAPA